ELHEPGPGLGEPLHRRARFVDGRELQAVSIRTPAPGRVSPRRRQQRSSEADAQRWDSEREQPFGLAEIEDRRDPAAQLGARDLRDVAGDGKVHVRVDESRQQHESGGVHGARTRRWLCCFAGDASAFDADRRGAQAPAVVDAATGNPKLGREKQRRHSAGRVARNAGASALVGEGRRLASEGRSRVGKARGKLNFALDQMDEADRRAYEALRAEALAEAHQQMADDPLFKKAPATAASAAPRPPASPALASAPMSGKPVAPSDEPAEPDTPGPRKTLGPRRRKGT